MQPDPTVPRAPSGPAGSVVLRGVSHTFAASDRGRRGTDRSGPTPAIDRIDLDVAPGEVVALVGPSGCGKSTLVRIVAGLTVPTEGTALVGGVDVGGRPGACAWMPQHHALLPWRRVLANATLGAEVRGMPRADAQARARPLLDRFGLGGFERAWPGQLSGGMRQRLAVLRTFLVDAPVLLLDEPLGALDALTRREMQTWMQEVLAVDPAGGAAAAEAGAAEATGGGGRTVLLVTHDVEEAILLADRVVVLSPRPARVVADVRVDLPRPRPADLVADPRVVSLRASLLAALGA